MQMSTAAEAWESAMCAMHAMLHTRADRSAAAHCSPTSARNQNDCRCVYLFSLQLQSKNKKVRTLHPKQFQERNQKHARISAARVHVACRPSLPLFPIPPLHFILFIRIFEPAYFFALMAALHEASARPGSYPFSLLPIRPVSQTKALGTGAAFLSLALRRPSQIPIPTQWDSPP